MSRKKRLKAEIKELEKDLAEAEKYIVDLERASGALGVANQLLRDRVKELEDKEHDGGLDS